MTWVGDAFNTVSNLFSSDSSGEDNSLLTAALPAAILGGTSLASGLLSGDDELARLQFEESKRQFDLNRELAERKLALDAAQGSGNSGAALAAARLAADTQKKIANQQIQFQIMKEKLGARQLALQELLKAAEGHPELLAAARNAQIQSAQNTGNTAVQAFNNLTASLQRPILRA